MKRAAALAAAIALVAVALLVRDKLDSDSTLAGRLECSTEFVETCAKIGRDHPGIDINLQNPFETTRRMADPEGGDDPGFDAWLVSKSYAEIAIGNLERVARTPLITAPGSALAHSPLTFFINPERFAVLEQHCGGAISWACIVSASEARNWADIGGDPAWGEFKPHIPEPTQTPGLVALGNLATVRIAPEPVDAIAIGDESFVRDLSALSSAQRDASSPLSAIANLAVSPATYNLVAALEVDGSQFEESGPGAALHRVVPPGGAAAEAVVVGRSGSPAGDDLVELVESKGRGMLASHGWRQGPASDFSPLPSTGALITLISQWEELQ